MTMKIIINGYFGFGNTGDEVFPWVIREKLKSMGCDVEMSVVSYRPGLPVPEGMAALDFYNPSGTYEALKDADLVLTGGGGLFQDYYKVRSDTFFKFPVNGPLGYHYVPMMAKFLDLPVVYFAQGLGPLDSIEMAGPLRLMAKAIEGFSVRDEASLNLLREVAGDQDHFCLSGDPAIFAADFLPPVGEKKGIGLNLRPWPEIDDRWIEKFGEALRPVCKVNGDVSLIPFQWESGSSDVTPLSKLKSHLAGAVTLEESPKEPLEVFSQIASCEVMVGMRLHSLIFAASAGVIPVALNYDPKVLEFMTRIGLEELCLPLNVSSRRLRKVLRGVLQDRETFLKRLVEGVRLYREQAEVGFAQVESLLKTPRGGLFAGGKYKSYSPGLPAPEWKPAPSTSEPGAPATSSAPRGSEDDGWLRALQASLPEVHSGSGTEAVDAVVIAGSAGAVPLLVELLAEAGLTVFEHRGGASLEVLRVGRYKPSAPTAGLYDEVRRARVRGLVVLSEREAKTVLTFDSDWLLYCGSRREACGSLDSLLRLFADEVVETGLLREGYEPPPNVHFSMEDPASVRAYWFGKLRALMREPHTTSVLLPKLADFEGFELGFEPASVTWYERSELGDLQVGEGGEEYLFVPDAWVEDPLEFYRGMMMQGRPWFVVNLGENVNELFLSRAQFKTMLEASYPDIFLQKLMLYLKLCGDVERGLCAGVRERLRLVSSRPAGPRSAMLRALLKGVSANGEVFNEELLAAESSRERERAAALVVAQDENERLVGVLHQAEQLGAQNENKRLTQMLHSEKISRQQGEDLRVVQVNHSSELSRAQSEIKRLQQVIYSLETGIREPRHFEATDGWIYRMQGNFGEVASGVRYAASAGRNLALTAVQPPSSRSLLNRANQVAERARVKGRGVWDRVGQQIRQRWEGDDGVSGEEIVPEPAPRMAGAYYSQLRLNPPLEGDVRDLLKGLLESHSKVILYPPTTDWGYFRARPHHMMSEFAKRGYLALFMVPDKEGEPAFVRQEGENLYVLHKIPCELLRGYSEKLCVYVSWALNWEYCRQLPDADLIYDIIDELEVFHLYGERYEWYHEELVEAANLVLYSADVLLNLTRDRADEALLVPNAAVLEDFDVEEGSKVSFLEARPFGRNGRPVIGYYGVFARWFDYALMQEVVEAMPEVDFVLIGPNYDNTLAKWDFFERENVYYLGKKPYGELPSYLQAFDVALLPFLVNRVTMSTSPVKIFEYLAGGKQVVSTPLHECKKYECILLSEYSKEREENDAASFVEQIREAYERSKDPRRRRECLRLAKENSWRARVGTVLDAYEAHFTRGSSARALRSSST